MSTYPSNMRAERLTARNSELFDAKLKELMYTSKDKNRDWYKHLLDSWCFMFEAWYIVFDEEDNLIAFSAVQPFEDDWWRLLTRYWHSTRKTGLKDGIRDDEVSPAMLMLELQLKEFGEEKCFISMEYINRREHIRKLASKINKMFDEHWILNQGMQLTCDDQDSFSCWQNTISNTPLNRPSISIDEYLERFKGERKKVKRGKFKQEIQNYVCEFNETHDRQFLVDFYNKHLNKLELKGRQDTLNFNYMDRQGGWQELMKYFIGYCEKAGINIDLDQIKTMIGFSFIIIEPNGILLPHTASEMRAMCSINFPVLGKHIVDVYKDHESKPHRHGEKVGELYYTNPILLNIHNFHGVRNETDDVRVVLKTHIFAPTYDIMHKAYHNPEVQKIFNFKMPWCYERGTRQKI